MYIHNIKYADLSGGSIIPHAHIWLGIIFCSGWTNLLYWYYEWCVYVNVFQNFFRVVNEMWLFIVVDMIVKGRYTYDHFAVPYRVLVLLVTPLLCTWWYQISNFGSLHNSMQLPSDTGFYLLVIYIIGTTAKYTCACGYINFTYPFKHVTHNFWTIICYSIYNFEILTLIIFNTQYNCMMLLCNRICAVVSHSDKVDKKDVVMLVLWHHDCVFTHLITWSTFISVVALC